MRVLFVSNGHGEAAIADRIALEVRKLAAQAQLDHLALVGEPGVANMREVGPARAMPSGGLIAMGNLRNIARDVRGGLLGLVLAQYCFLRGARGAYDAVVAVGDVYALGMALRAGARTVFVGTAKSVSVAPYGRFEERVLRRAAFAFVRDEPTEMRLRARGVPVEAAANVIVDLFLGTPPQPGAERAAEGFAPLLALFPGSRENAYADARFLTSIVRALAPREPALGAVLSIAPRLDAERFAAQAQSDGWTLVRGADPLAPFELRDGERTLVRAWRGSLGPVIERAALVLGQAGTANEAAAAAGVPVVAFERGRDRKNAWYRKRQRGLLGDALAILPGDPRRALEGVRELLHDGARRAHMGREGRARMGAPGGARRIAERIVEAAS